MPTRKQIRSRQHFAAELEQADGALSQIQNKATGSPADQNSHPIKGNKTIVGKATGY